jgi:hypothetical protein
MQLVEQPAQPIHVAHRNNRLIISRFYVLLSGCVQAIHIVRKQQPLDRCWKTTARWDHIRTIYRQKKRSPLREASRTQPRLVPAFALSVAARICRRIPCGLLGTTICLRPTPPPTWSRNYSLSLNVAPAPPLA